MNSEDTPYSFIVVKFADDFYDWATAPQGQEIQEARILGAQLVVIYETMDQAQNYCNIMNKEG